MDVNKDNKEINTPLKSFVIEAEVSLTKEDFDLFLKLTSILDKHVGDVIISCARDKANEILLSKECKPLE